MKSIKKILGGALMAVAAFGFFACSDSEEDEELVVNITYDESAKKVTMTTDEKYGDKEVHIAYTLDGSDMSVTYDESAYEKTPDKDNLATYFDYGTAAIYDSKKGIVLTSSAEIVAKAFYVNDEGKCIYGPAAKKSITITNDTTGKTDADANASGDLNFKLATGNNMSHYYDTSAETFAYTSGDTTYDHCYYQIQFSYKGSGKGNWYLYVRQLANGKIIPYSDTQKFLANGTYTGSCFDSSSGVVAQGDLTLTSANEKWTRTVSPTGGDYSSFTLKVDENTSDSGESGSTTGKTLIESINDAK